MIAASPLAPPAGTVQPVTSRAAITAAARTRGRSGRKAVSVRITCASPSRTNTAKSCPSTVTSRRSAPAKRIAGEAQAASRARRRIAHLIPRSSGHRG